MVDEIIREIKLDLESKINLKELDMTDVWKVHFGVCLYIRNKYLWENKPRTEMLLEYFNLENVDDLSHKILEKIRKDYV